MAAIDDRIQTLNYEVVSRRPLGQIHQVIGDAARVSDTTGPKTSLAQVSGNRVDGVIRTSARLQMAAFTIMFAPAPNGFTHVRFSIVDYLRTRDTLFYFIPIGPWSARVSHPQYLQRLPAWSPLTQR